MRVEARADGERPRRRRTDGHGAKHGARRAPRDHDGPGPDAELPGRAIDHLRRLVKAIHSHSVAIEAVTGLSGPQFWALKEIARAADGVTLGELAERLALHKANAGRLADRLARRRLVRRETPADDRRVVRVKVTAKGLERAELPLSAPPQAHLLSRLEALPAAELRAIEQALARLVELMGAGAEEPSPLFDERA